MSVKYCSKAGCYNFTILSEKKKLCFEIPKSETIRYFCEDHFPANGIEGEDLKRFAAPLHNVPEEESNHLVYSNRLKSLKPPPIPTPNTSTDDSSTTPPSHTLVDNDSNKNDTRIQLVFRDFAGDDVVLPIDSSPSDLVVDDGGGDCVITNEIASTINDFKKKIKVIEVVQQRRERDMTVESVESDGYPSLNDDATQGKIRVVYVKSLQPRKLSNVASKTERNSSDQPTKKRRVPVIVVDDNSSNESDDPDTPTVDEKSSQLFGNIRYYNSNKMFARTNSYLGVSTESLKLLENLLRDGSKMQFALLLLLRKLKLNEPFSTLSEVLCWSRRDCRHLYETSLIEASNNLRELIQWPANCRETNGIADIFEVEIGKPQSFVEQHLSFCNQRQRYFMKFLVSITTSGYITHVSIPFYSIQSDTLDSCLASNRQSCSTLAVNPILMNCRSNKNLQTTTVPLCKSDRRSIQVVFKRMRRFATLTQITDVKNAKYTQHVVRLVASLCNINQT